MEQCRWSSVSKWRPFLGLVTQLQASREVYFTLVIYIANVPNGLNKLIRSSNWHIAKQTSWIQRLRVFLSTTIQYRIWCSGCKQQWTDFITNQNQIISAPLYYGNPKSCKSSLYPGCLRFYHFSFIRFTFKCYSPLFSGLLDCDDVLHRTGCLYGHTLSRVLKIIVFKCWVN